MCLFARPLKWIVGPVLPATWVLLVAWSSIEAAQIAPNPNPEGNVITVSGPDENVGTQFVNEGTVQVTPNGSLDNQGSFVSLHDAVFDNAGTTLNGGNLNFFGLATNRTGALIESSGSIGNEGGPFDNQAGATIRNNGNFTNQGLLDNAGTIRNSLVFSNSRLNVDTVGVLNNRGSLTNNWRFLNSSFLTNYGVFTNHEDASFRNVIDFANSTEVTNEVGALVKNFGTLTNERFTVLNNFGDLENRNGIVDNFGSLLNAGVLESSGTLENRLGGDLDNFQTLVNMSGGELVNTGTLTNYWRLENGGAVTNNRMLNNRGNVDNQRDALLTNTFVLNNSGSLTNQEGAVLDNAKVFTNQLGASLINEGKLDNREFLANSGTLDNTGTFNLLAGASYESIDGTLNNNDGGTINLAEDLILDNFGIVNLKAGGTLNNFSTLTNAANHSQTNFGLLLNHSGAKVSNLGVLENSIGATLVNDGILDTTAGFFENDGVLSGMGTHIGNLNDAGTISPGESAGVYTITGGWNKSGGVLQIEIGGLFDGGGDKSQTEFDWLDVTDDVIVPRLGDANNDGLVTGADLISVQANFGTIGQADGFLLGDADHDGRVTGADIVAVQQNFGMGALLTGDVDLTDPATVELSYLAPYDGGELTNGDRFDVVRFTGRLSGFDNLTLDDSRVPLPSGLAWTLAADAQSIFIEVTDELLSSVAVADGHASGAELNLTNALPAPVPEPAVAVILLTLGIATCHR